MLKIKTNVSMYVEHQKKKNNGVEYLYYVCHRSNNPRSSSTVNKLIIL